MMIWEVFQIVAVISIVFGVWMILAMPMAILMGRFIANGNDEDNEEKAA